jgi:hypothetical protein
MGECVALLQPGGAKAPLVTLLSWGLDTMGGTGAISFFLGAITPMTLVVWLLVSH